MIIFVQTLFFMEDLSLQTINIGRIKSLTPIVDEYALGNDFIIGEVSGRRVEKSEILLSMLRYPFRFDGFIIFFLRRGHFRVDLNLNTFELKEHSVLMVVPGNIVKLSSPVDSRLVDTELIFVLVSREFMSGIRFDFNKVFQEGLRMWDNPCISLDGDDLKLAEDYFNLARTIVVSHRNNKLEVMGSLLTSFLYVLVDFWMARLSVAQKQESRSSARMNQVFERFIALVTEYHTTERGMAFYADKLCLTPKYLSKLVKQATGRSAPDWIDSFVILEAKNLLKYSDKTIKEIVFALHFPNQSVFYKFFKAHTDMTPSEYRKG